MQKEQRANVVFPSSEKVKVFVREDGERGVKAQTSFRPGQFVCEFEANHLTPEEFMIAEKEYTREHKTVYALEVRCS